MKAPMQWRRSLAAWVVLTLASVALGFQATAAVSTVKPQSFATLEATLHDDPRLATAQALQQLELASDPGARLWAHLALARINQALERQSDAALSIQQARAALAGWPAAGQAERLWLEQSALLASWSSLPPAQAQEQARALRQQVLASHDAALVCDFHGLELSLLLDINSLDEAWLSAEALEQCSKDLGDRFRSVLALQAMGTIVGRGNGRRQADAQDAFNRALALLGDEPARMARSVLHWEWGQVLRGAQQAQAALHQFTQAKRLSQAIADQAGIAAADLAAAGALLQLDRPAEVLVLLSEAQGRLEEIQDKGFRLLTLTRLKVEAMARLRQPAVLRAMDQARRWDTPSTPPSDRAELARALATGYASQGRFADAYREIERRDRLMHDARNFATDVQTLRLQARYAAAQREAENAELRHREEAARLALMAQTARQRALWVTVVTLALLLAGGGIWARRALIRRRWLADLALRDDLTGQPNRRAVRAYAEAQVQQAQRLGVPLALAIIDLDHFKAVNDALGHAGGDCILRAFASAATGVLRGQDRLGRWGGEEWLLVLPGTAVDELPAVFDRLRS